jgi:hypothetical protein
MELQVSSAQIINAMQSMKVSMEFDGKCMSSSDVLCFHSQPF